MTSESIRTKQTARVFKKSSANGKLTVYLSKRDFLDHLTHVDPIDGVVLVDPEYLDKHRVYAHVLAAFRYGREDLDVLGLAFRKDLFLASMQVFPVIKDQQTSLTKMQERLLKKLGTNAFPFYFELPHQTPASVTLQPGPDDTGKPCGVDYELNCFIATGEQPNHRSSVRLAIRKLTYAADECGPQPMAEIVREFMMSPGVLRMEACLDKEKYYHGETIAVNVLVDNRSTKRVKCIRLTVVQMADIMLFSKATYKCVVDKVDSDDGFPVQPCQTGWSKVYHLCPLLANNRDKLGLALDGKLRHEDTNLASSTIIRDQNQKENLGIIVQYCVKVRLIMGFGTSDVFLELPFTLTHPKPPDAETDEFNENNSAMNEPTVVNSIEKEQITSEVDTNLINLETLFRETDDLVFEDFTRLRLQETDDVDA